MNQTTSARVGSGSPLSASYRDVSQKEHITAGPKSFADGFLGLDKEVSGTITTYYTRDPKGNVLSERIVPALGPPTTYHYLKDGPGSTVALVDSSGNLATTYAYDPYGNLTSSTGTAPNPCSTSAGTRTPQPASTSLGCATTAQHSADGRSVTRSPPAYLILRRPTAMATPETTPSMLLIHRALGRWVSAST